jgi:two-component system chemotaxis response regulator CheY
MQNARAWETIGIVEEEGLMSRLVLVVEDSPQMAENLEMALEALPELEVRVTASGTDALRLLDGAADVDLAAVITDLEMPRMDGFEFIERLRANPRYRRIPIIVSSGSSDPDSPGRARRLGADAYFAKPYSLAALRRKLEELIQSDAGE